MSEKHKIEAIDTDMVHHLWEATCCKHPHLWWNWNGFLQLTD